MSIQEDHCISRFHRSICQLEASEFAAHLEVGSVVWSLQRLFNALLVYCSKSFPNQRCNLGLRVRLAAYIDMCCHFNIFQQLQTRRADHLAQFCCWDLLRKIAVFQPQWLDSWNTRKEKHSPVCSSCFLSSDVMSFKVVQPNLTEHNISIAKFIRILSLSLN